MSVKHIQSSKLHTIHSNFNDWIMDMFNFFKKSIHTLEVGMKLF